MTCVKLSQGWKLSALPPHLKGERPFGKTNKIKPKSKYLFFLFSHSFFDSEDDDVYGICEKVDRDIDGCGRRKFSAEMVSAETVSAEVRRAAGGRMVRRRCIERLPVVSSCVHAFFALNR